MNSKPKIERVLVPVALLETLIDAACRAYLPAFEGRPELVDDAYNAARAARNIIDRAQRRG